MDLYTSALIEERRVLKEQPQYVQHKPYLETGSSIENPADNLKSAGYGTLLTADD